MPGFKDRIGDQYGRLTVIGHAGKDHRNKHLWLCKCTCGNTNRSFIGIELNENYFNIAKNRVEDAYKDHDVLGKGNK